MFLVPAVFAFVLGACKDENNPAAAGATTTNYVGVMAGTGVSGTLTISITTGKRAYPATNEAGDTLEVTATLKINGGAAIPLTGYFIVATGELYLAGGGYAFEGVFSAGTITGTFTYPGGGGIFNCDEGNAADVRTYCGRYQDAAPGTEAGYLNMTISGTSIVVLVYPDGAPDQAFMAAGTINAENVITIFNPDAPSLVIATGMLNTVSNTASGEYAGDPGGTWSAEPCH